MTTKLSESQSRYSPEEIDRLIDDPQQVAAQLAEFRASMDLFSRGAPTLPAECQGRWVGAYRGEIRVVAESLEELHLRAQAAGIPRGQMYVHYAGERPIII